MILMRGSAVEHLEHDLACGIALGFFEHRRARVTLEALTLYDAHLRVMRMVSPWLGDTDPLDWATHDYLTARRNMWRDAASLPVPPQARAEAMADAAAARARAHALLLERDAWARARAAGLVVLEEANEKQRAAEED